MFCDIKNELDNPVVREILSESMFDNSPEAVDLKVAEIRRKSDWQVFGVIEGDKFLGVCVFEVHTDWVEILHIAVPKNMRTLGVGSAMITALRHKYLLRIEAETDEDAVEFYRKYGFETIEIKKYNVRRWTCLLPALKRKEAKK